MNVEELMKILKAMPPKSRVIIEGYEGGYDDILVVKKIPIRLNANKEDQLGAHKLSTSLKAKIAVGIIGVERN